MQLKFDVTELVRGAGLMQQPVRGVGTAEEPHKAPWQVAPTSQPPAGEGELTVCGPGEPEGEAHSDGVRGGRLGRPGRQPSCLPVAGRASRNSHRPAFPG